MTPALAGRRLIEAFRVNGRLPRNATPQEPRCAHPQMEYSDEERAEWEAAPFDPFRAPPSEAEVVAMEESFALLPPLAALDLDAYRAARGVAKAMAWSGNLKPVARKLGISPAELVVRARRAFERIAELNQQGAAMAA